MRFASTNEHLRKPFILWCLPGLRTRPPTVPEQCGGFDCASRQVNSASSPGIALLGNSRNPPGKRCLRNAMKGFDFPLTRYVFMRLEAQKTFSDPGEPVGLFTNFISLLVFLLLNSSGSRQSQD